MTVDKNDSTFFLDSVEGEISFFRSIMRARPVGIHRHFHMLTVQNSMFKATGRVVAVDDIWKKVKSCYDMDALEAIDLEAENYEYLTSKGVSPPSIQSPSPSENLSRHPYFREEFSLPYEEYEPLISQRRMRATASLPSSSPAPSPPRPTKGRGSKKRGRTNLSMAGLVGGDSDSSALTQESGDEVVGTPRGSVVTGTDGGTDYAEEELDVEMHEPSPAASASPKPTRGRGKAGKKGATSTRAKAAAAAAGSTRVSKKRKR